MKVKVCDFRNVNSSYWVDGISTFYNNGKYENRIVTLRIAKELFEKSIKLPIKFPLVLDVKFKKGIGINELKSL